MSSNTKTLEARVAEIIIEQIGSKPEDVKPEARFFEDLGADSLDIVELAMAFEDEFGITILDEEMEKLHTIGEAIAFIKERQ